MRKASFLLLLTLLTALPLAAADRGQSYISYDDGGTLVRQSDDDREIEARVNLPIFPGDELVTSRRGRSEVRLSDGNILGVDRATAIRFRSILDSYDGDSSQTVAELRYGKVMVYRTENGREFIRLDTGNASYVASFEAIYAVERDAKGYDRVEVFDGSIEVRTPARTSRLRSGEAAEVDDRGIANVTSTERDGVDDFERWFMRRAEKYGDHSSKYLDRRYAYYDDELDDYGNWVYVSGIGWSWRPHVAAGWRPYYHGYWMSSHSGCLTWVSYEPWGWMPYHYGRWSYDPVYGWVWVPGYGYAPAWVYWMYGYDYIGWAPAGWWDCYRPYYDWGYKPYVRAGLDFGFGFYGRVTVRDIDLGPWTFVGSHDIVSNRVDRAALTTDAVRARLQRGGTSGFATVSTGPARFTRQEFRDPAAAINRRAIGSGTGKETGSPADVTSFIRRDPELGSGIRERIVRSRGNDGGSTGTTARNGGTIGGGSVAPIGGGSVAPIGGGSLAPISGNPVAPIGRGSLAPISGDPVAPIGNSGNSGNVNRGAAPTEPARGSGGTGRDSGGHINRGGSTPEQPRTGTPPQEPTSGRESGSGLASPTWRERVDRPSSPRSSNPDDSNGTANSGSSVNRGGNANQPSSSWRDRVARGGGETTPAREGSSAGSTAGSTSRGSDVPRRIIDRIGGARVTPAEPRSRDRGSDGGNVNRGGGHSGGGSSSSSGSSSSGSSNSGSSNSGGGMSRGNSTPPPPPPPPPPSNSGGNRGESGQIQRGKNDQ